MPTVRALFVDDCKDDDLIVTLNQAVWSVTALTVDMASALESASGFPPLLTLSPEHGLRALEVATRVNTELPFCCV